MRKFGLLLLVAILLSACSTPAVSATDTQDSGAVMTAVEQTVIYDLTQSVALTPTVTSTPVSTFTALPSITPRPATPTDTQVVTLTLAPSNTLVRADGATLLSQDVPDGFTYDPGHEFGVTWTFKNEGTTTWTTGYAAKFVSGSLMGATQKVYFNKSVDPGETISISVIMTAPSKEGTYESHWYLRNQNDINFFAFYVIIKVR